MGKKGETAVSIHPQLRIGIPLRLSPRFVQERQFCIPRILVRTINSPFALFPLPVNFFAVSLRILSNSDASYFYIGHFRSEFCQYLTEITLECGNWNCCRAFSEKALPKLVSSHAFFAAEQFLRDKRAFLRRLIHNFSLEISIAIDFPKAFEQSIFEKVDKQPIK